ncbi:MAG TPA: nucleotide exchange factor GrpE [Leucothrix mucor]|uniref:Protein GrpE n=1 Tax=Leucothrix mucor TaxID=45248 RepID=A0A7V2T464_LEUMU|nr:nucleotide exchange factor GrpE [Leucothrix mucor]
MLQLQNEQLLAQFEDFLQQEEQFTSENIETLENTDRQVDLYQLFSELSALKSEVKKDARQQKDALGQFTNLLDTLQGGNKQLSKELERHDTNRNNAVTRAKKDLLGEVIDINDRLRATVASLHHFKPPLMERKASREFRLGLQEGLEMTLRRLELLLNSHEVIAVGAIGQTVDPYTMRVSEVVEDNKQPDGIVVEEIQRGYLYKGKLLRLAEVVANKKVS